METCPASGNAPSVYLIEEVTGSIPVAPTSCFFDTVPNNIVGICRYFLVSNLRNSEWLLLFFLCI